MATKKTNSGRKGSPTMGDVRSRHSNRTGPAQIADEAITHRRTYGHNPTTAQMDEWLNDPASCDIQGIDTPDKTRKRKSPKPTQRSAPKGKVKTTRKTSSAKKPTATKKVEKKVAAVPNGLEPIQRMREGSPRIKETIHFATLANKKPISTVHTDGNGYEAADLALKKYMRQPYAKSTLQGLPIHAIFYDAWMGSFDVICSNQFGYVRGRGYNPETGQWSTGRYDRTWAQARDLCNGKCIWYEESDDRVKVRRR